MSLLILFLLRTVASFSDSFQIISPNTRGIQPQAGTTHCPSRALFTGTASVSSPGQRELRDTLSHPLTTEKKGCKSLLVTTLPLRLPRGSLSAHLQASPPSFPSSTARIAVPNSALHLTYTSERRHISLEVLLKPGILPGLLMLGPALSLW